MRLRDEFLLILFLLLSAAVVIAATEFIKPDVQEEDASQFVVDDLKNTYPGAEVGIISINEKENPEGEAYFEVKAKVVEDYDTPCPRRMHLYYNYPVQNFVPQSPDIITDNCEVCTEGICVLVFPEHAVIASHTFNGTEAVHDFIYTYDAMPAVSEMKDSWEVTWYSEEYDYFYKVRLSKNGELISTEHYQEGDS